MIPDTMTDLLGEGTATKYEELATNIFEFAVVALFLYILGRLVFVPVALWLLSKREVDRTVEVVLEKIVRGSVVVFAVLVGIAAGGGGGVLGASTVVVAAATLAVGFAARDVISNFVAGVFIVQDDNFNIDDWIEWEGNAGYIDDIGFRSTRVRTFDNEVISVPNTQLVTTAVTNRMRKDRLRISYTFGIGYGDDIDATAEILKQEALKDNDVLEDPPPSVRITELADSSVSIQSRFWIQDPDREEFSDVRSAYIQRVKERFEDEGIDLSTTTQHKLSGGLGVDLNSDESPSPTGGERDSPNSE